MRINFFLKKNPGERVNLLQAMAAIILILLALALSFQNGEESNRMTLKIARLLQKTPLTQHKWDYLRLERRGNTFTQYYSSDGITWRLVDKPEDIELKDTIYVGLSVTSHNEQKICTAVFDNIKINSNKNLENVNWEETSIGGAWVQEQASYDKDKVKLQAGGNSDWNRIDENRFLYKKVTGDCVITARLVSVEEGDYWSLAGLSIRDTLEPGKKFASIVISPNGFLTPVKKNNTAIYMKWEHTAAFELNTRVRKTLHFMGYFILSAAMFWGLGIFAFKKPIRTFLAFFLCSSLALLDEYHQLFIKGREARITDVIIDTSGVLLAILLILVTHAVRINKVQK